MTLFLQFTVCRKFNSFSKRRKHRKNSIKITKNKQEKLNVFQINALLGVCRAPGVSHSSCRERVPCRRLPGEDSWRGLEALGEWLLLRRGPCGKHDSIRKLPTENQCVTHLLEKDDSSHQHKNKILHRFVSI